MKVTLLLTKLLKVLLILVCVVLDFYALVWLECFFFEKYDNPLRYFAPIYIPYIVLYIIVFIYLLVTGIRWIFGRCKRQIFIVFTFALFGLLCLTVLHPEEEIRKKINKGNKHDSYTNTK